MRHGIIFLLTFLSISASILGEECDGPNEFLNSCGSACGDNCPQPGEEPIYCTLQCVEKCTCIEGYCRDPDTGICIPEKDDQDPPTKECNGPNEFYNTCGSACGDYCLKPGEDPPGCTDQCVENCTCVEGYCRDPETGICALKKNNQCPPTKPKPEPRTCGKHEIWKKCGPVCGDDFCEPQIYCFVGGCGQERCYCDLEKGFCRDISSGVCIKRPKKSDSSQ